MSWRRREAKQNNMDAREFDTTSLRASQHGRYINRDYAAHFFRWGFATSYISNGDKVLDIGCGPDQALFRVLCHRVQSVPKKLLCVDYDDVAPVSMCKWFDLRPRFDFTRRWKELASEGPFDVIVCYEVIEHMQVASGRKLLAGARELLKPDGRFLLSTPVYDGKHMAHNHIHEYGLEELAKEIAKARLRVISRYGTFMSANDIKRHVRADHKEVWGALRAYYSDEVLACFLAPLYPDHSRNNMWVLKR